MRVRKRTLSEMLQRQNRGGWGGGGVLALEATGLLTKDDDSGGMPLVNSRNGFNELSRLVILWTVRQRWPEGARFAFNC